MTLTCREYVSVRCTGERAEQWALLLWLRDEIRVVEARRPSLRFKAKVFTETGQLEDELLDPAVVLAASGGVLPVLWVNLTYEAGDVLPGDVTGLEDAFELRLLGEFTA